MTEFKKVIKRSLTPRRRAREYALQGVYQALILRRAGSLPNAEVIAVQLAEDPAFNRCHIDLFQGIFQGILFNVVSLSHALIDIHRRIPSCPSSGKFTAKI